MQKTNNTQKKEFNKLPKQVTFKEFKKFFLPHLSLPKRGITPKPEKLWRIFNYILYQLDTGCQWDKIPIKSDPRTNKREISPSSVWKWYDRWSNDSSFEQTFINSVGHLKQKNKLRFKCINGDGTNSIAKKGAIK